MGKDLMCQLNVSLGDVLLLQILKHISTFFIILVMRNYVTKSIAMCVASFGYSNLSEIANYNCEISISVFTFAKILPIDLQIKIILMHL